MRKRGTALLLLMVLAFGTCAIAAVSADQPKGATTETLKANAALQQKLPPSSSEDFEDVQRGLIARPKNLDIRTDTGRPVWNMDVYDFQSPGAPAPDTVNPSLWRQAQLNNIYGLFLVRDRFYQVRGYDVSNITIIEGDSGLIVIDPLVSMEVARAAMDLYFQNRPRKPVVAVIYTHSHVDHFGGVRGVVNEADVAAGKVKIIAPEGFLEHAVSENIMAGSAMGRRSSYMYGTILPAGPRGQVDIGLGKGISTGAITLIPPTDIITKTGQEMTIDGVQIVFQLTPDTEAPAEMNFYFPQFRTLCIAENCSHNLHNVYTLRGAQVRDSKAWSHYNNEAIELFAGKTDVLFLCHQWPIWGQDRIVKYLKKQRDIYKYIHDQTLRLISLGYTGPEIAEMVELPESLSREWYNRGYYGSVSHDVKGIYQRYMGWFDGNPANLNALPPEQAAKKYVEFMGGASAVINKARKSYKAGDYRWVAQVMNHVVFANPQNREARNLMADALEQLGYQSEAGTWRNFYLSGAMELRKGVDKSTTGRSGGKDMYRALTMDMIFDYLGTRLDGPRAAGRIIVMNWNIKDGGQKYVLNLENSALTYVAGKQDPTADVTITLTRAALNGIVQGETTVEKEAAAGNIRLEGNREKVAELFSLFDKPNPFFNIMLPRDATKQ